MNAYTLTRLAIKSLIFLGVLCLFTAPTHGQVAPQLQNQPYTCRVLFDGAFDCVKRAPRAADKDFWFSVGELGAAWTADAVTTYQVFERCGYCRENGGLFDGSRSTPKIMLAWAAVDVGAAVLALEWKKHVHNKALNQLWRIPLGARTEGHTVAAWNNSQF